MEKKNKWSTKKVAKWLSENGWSQAIGIFKDYNIQHDRFLNIEPENVNELLKNTQLSAADKQQLASAIRELRNKDKRIQPRIDTNCQVNVMASSSTSSSSQPNFDIAPFIPKRTSSNVTNVSKILEAFQPTIRPYKGTSPTSPVISLSNPETLSKLLGKRLPVQEPTRPLFQDNHIQVTVDAETFSRLWLKNLSDAQQIKSAILHRLSIQGESRYFEFVHENGRNPVGKALTDEELIYICQTSNNANTNRVLVRPIAGYGYMDRPSTQQTYSDSSYQPQLHMNPFEDYNEETLYEPSSISPLSPYSDSRHALWAIPPQTQYSSPPNNLWPIPDQYQPTSYNDMRNSTINRIEGISLHDPPTPRFYDSVDVPNNNNNNNDDDGDNNKNNDDTSKHVHTSESDQTSQRSGQSSSDSDEDMFGERPSVEKLYKNIDRYLPGHDLDKEIIVHPASPSPLVDPFGSNQHIPSIGKRPLGHRLSVRRVANQAHNRWKQAVNVIQINQILRRKSTKMWDRKVERVKPGEEASIASLDKPPVATTKMQWIRGGLIGKGSFGRVYHALNLATGEWIAVKEVDTAITQADKRNKDLQEAADALYREISLLKDLDHENIVQYIGYDSDVTEGYIHIFLEYVPGGSISSLLSQFKPFDEVLTSFFTRQILKGLEYLHERHILHRDIKSGNLLIDLNGVCKIADFGLSKSNQDDAIYDPHSNNSSMRGSVFWMAPEVLTGNYSAKIDIWSLGCTVLEMLTGEHPWKELPMLAALYQIGNNKSPEIPNDISDEAKDFLRLCFIINPDDRPTATELLSHPFVSENKSFDFKEHVKAQKKKMHDAKTASEELESTEPEHNVTNSDSQQEFKQLTSNSENDEEIDAIETDKLLDSEVGSSGDDFTDTETVHSDFAPSKHNTTSNIAIPVSH